MPELFQLNEESLMKFYNMIDLENILANEEKLKVAIAAQPLQNLLPKARTFQNNIIRKRSPLNEGDAQGNVRGCITGYERGKKE